MTTTDRRDATDAQFADELARLDRLDAADVAADVEVERVARAICESDEDGPWDEWPEHVHVVYRHYARAAIDALKPAPSTDTSGQAFRTSTTGNRRETQGAG